ncbi:MAG TPA: hypothetical protein VMW16_11560 [Sedimentisphaerales bacterium]|nr:hypothetical protein [Sedimentisphaerales bacterium]
MRKTKVKLGTVCALAVWLLGLTIPAVAGTPCVVPDNGSGTVTLPPAGCQHTSPDDVFRIIEGLPPDTTIEMEGVLMDFVCCSGPSLCVSCSIPLDPCECETAGGSLGGHGHCFEATLDLTVTGTGSLEGFNRRLWVPVFAEVHTGPRNPGDPVQAFATDFFRLQGEILGDPDFCTFRITWGTDYGLPSPGHTTLTELPTGNFDVDSFFDITYQIEFEGCAGSQLDDYAGTTTATIRIETGFEECAPMPDGLACRTSGCPVPSECVPTLVNFDPCTGWVTVIDCNCRGPDGCRVDVSGAPGFNCIVPDNGAGTADLPPQGCEYTSPTEVYKIIDGLPAGTTIELDGPLYEFTNIVKTPGGTLGGEKITFDATLSWDVRGTGSLAGFNRHLWMPLSGELHTAPRNPGDPVQTFATHMYLLQGELFGDPDFCTLRFRAGADLGLPSPGQTTLVELPNGDFAVDSFFDITYQIEFAGCAGSQLEDYSGTTTATIRVETGGGPVQPTCIGDCPPSFACDDTIVVKGDGTLDISCDCAPVDCEPTEDGSACKAAACPGAEQCQPTSVNFDPNTGRITVPNCNCRGAEECHVDISTDPGFNCVVPDNGSGTVDMPPQGCEYTSPDEVYLIIDGLPPETTIELDGPLGGFFNVVSRPGGSLGGDRSTFEADLQWQVRGTGELEGFNRFIAMPLTGELHTGPRNPGDPVQTFATDMFQLQGELFGDPDFCTLRFRAGTDLGLPSPGHTTLVKLPSGDFAVDSFFDITYQIEFEGCPGSQLQDYAGITTAAIRVETGGEPVQPTCTGDCPACEFCDEISIANPDGTVNISCNCVRDADLNGDGKVDFRDLAILASQWLRGTL